MELVFLAAGLNTWVPRLCQMIKDNEENKSAIYANSEAIIKDSKRLKAALENDKFKGDGSSTAMALKCEARTLSQDTRDCIQRFLKHKNARCKDFKIVTEMYSRQILDLCKRVEDYPSASKRPEYPSVAKPMGMDEFAEELQKLVTVPGRPSDEGRKVITIVGFAGQGKTVLAKMVYDQDMGACTLRARVVAAAKQAREVLREILEILKTEGNHDKLSLEELVQLLANGLKGERYFIVIDDIQSIHQWSCMEAAFPKDGGGTIIVTTTIQSVANICSPWNGYVYNLSPLDYDSALDLFLNDRTFWNRSSMDLKASDILKKCDGLRIAIVNMSLMLQKHGEGEPTSNQCTAACTNIGTYLSTDSKDLKSLRWVLMNKYTGLSCEALRSCLLYYCLYKHKMDAVPRRNSLIRLWDAEGFLLENNSSSSATGQVNLETFVDGNIMQSMEVGTDGTTRRCRPSGMMVEYISQISIDENFAALVSDGVTTGIRRLSFHPGSARDNNKISDMKLKNVLTLTVSGVGCKAILNFKEYDLIAVLELKECTNLKNKHVKYICKLLLLKYLSLGETIEEIPSDLEKLKLLETLEMRRNARVLVYAEVLEKLPKLKHLLGNFQLHHKPGGSTKSDLETVTGYVTKTTKGFPKLMQYMKRLRKLKIHCTPTASKRDRKDLEREIKAFTSDTDPKNGRSLSIDFAQFTRDNYPSHLKFLTRPGNLESLKLHGVWVLLYFTERKITGRNTIQCALPYFTKISGIRKLCLKRTCLTEKQWVHVLADLGNLIGLEYLKLDEENLGPLKMKKKEGSFQMLTRLCLVGETSLKDITIEADALPSLVSLHLICKRLQLGLDSSIGIDGVKSLREIALDSEVDNALDSEVDKPSIQGEKREITVAWKRTAMDHPNRPQVLVIQKGAPIRQA
ncbi:unnamed protein product [Alopecurus aequalis]